MRNPLRGDHSGRRARELGRRGGVPCAVSGPAFGGVAEADEEAVIDPVELLAIRADDEILDDLAFALTSAPGAGAVSGLTSCLGSDPRYADDLRLLALLEAWRHDVDDEPWSELVSVEQARAAVLAGAVRPALAAPSGMLRGRRPTPLAALAVASVVAALGMSGLGLAAGQARPGDALWGVSKMLDANRATSLEAEGRVGVALASARRALAEGRPGDARAELAGVARELQRVRDPAIRQDLAHTTDKLTATA
ncbi:MAG: hypothetical protein J2P19_24985, partial [Pseudonocardia sp.]|nr:hypothetical protein [Pseudonocardia sp.]